MKEGERFNEMGELYEKLNRETNAIELYKKSGNIDKLMQLYIKRKNIEAAGVLLEDNNVSRKQRNSITITASMKKPPRFMPGKDSTKSRFNL